MTRKRASKKPVGAKIPAVDSGHLFPRGGPSFEDHPQQLAEYSDEQLLNELRIRSAQYGDTRDALRRAADEFKKRKAPVIGDLDLWNVLKLWTDCLLLVRSGVVEIEIEDAKQRPTWWAIELTRWVLNDRYMGIMGKRISHGHANNLIGEACKASRRPGFPPLLEGWQEIIDERLAQGDKKHSKSRQFKAAAGRPGTRTHRIR